MWVLLLRVCACARAYVGVGSWVVRRVEKEKQGRGRGGGRGGLDQESAGVLFN